MIKHVTASDIQEMSKVNRLNFVNSCTGYKSANLIGTRSEEEQTNLAIFNSFVHLGSSPALIGFILRPLTVPRHTYENFKKTGVFTVNHVTKNMIEDAHHTSASYAETVSEFSKTTLTEEYLDGFHAPYVKESPIKIGCSYKNEYPIIENDTLLIVAAIEHIYYDESLQAKDGWLQLDKGNVVAVNGLDGYAETKLLDRFLYARPDQETKSFE
ncbi:flavin reductase family protein [Ascidiimonas sp. W6]|uniref:flavin reductase family protein n=1 Tax=Ascidiimonas meishanensis TaxID=3128903 RepID=UPI0030EEFAD2